MLEALACAVRVEPELWGLALVLAACGASLAVLLSRRLPLALAVVFPAMALAAEMVLILCRGVLPSALALFTGAVAVAAALMPAAMWLLMLPIYSIPPRLSRRPRPGEEERGATDVLNAHAELGLLGFRMIGRLFVEDGLERQVGTYWSDASGAVVARRTAHMIGAKGYVFISEQDSARIVTSNWLFLLPWAPPPGTVLHYHRRCRTAAELLRCHRRHLEEHSIGAPIRRSGSEILDRQVHAYEESLEEAVREGILFRDRAGRYRMTLRGVYVGLWRGFLADTRRAHVRVEG